MQYLVLLMLSGLGITSVAAAENPTVVQRIEATKPAIDKHGVKVWTYQTTGNPAFNYRATTTMNGSVSSIVAAILDTDYLSSWVPYTRKVDVLKRDEQNGTFILRMELDFPFPLKDRDVVVFSKLTQATDGTVTLMNRSTTDARAPARADMVRISHYEGSWIVRPLGKGRSEVVTTGYADPGGILPLPVVNMFVQQQPYDMLQIMQKIVQSPRYKDARLSMIREP
jgi:hypothetical protein